MKHRYLEAGKIVNTHGIAGEVKIMPWADDPDFLLNFKTLYLDGKPIHIRSARVHKNAVLMKLDGVDDINEAMRPLWSGSPGCGQWRGAWNHL